MATTLAVIETQVRRQLQEASASFWTSAEIIDHEITGIKDLWRDTVDLKQEHYLVINTTDVSLAASTGTLTGVPVGVHKIYLIEPRDISSDSANHGLIFTPLDYNHKTFQMARSMDAVDPSNATIYYAITGQGAPVNAPTIYIAPQVNSAVNISFAYVPVLDTMTSTSVVPIPGEADNAIIYWTIAHALAKDREGGGPHPEWLSMYATEKTHLLQSLGLRQLQELQYVDAVFEEYW